MGEWVKRPKGQLTSIPAAVRDTAGSVVVASSEASGRWDTTCRQRPGTSADPPVPSASGISARSQVSIGRVGIRDGHRSVDGVCDRSGTYLWVRWFVALVGSHVGCEVVSLQALAMGVRLLTGSAGVESEMINLESGI
jgi:hypothetical protein